MLNSGSHIVTLRAAAPDGQQSESEPVIIRINTQPEFTEAATIIPEIGIYTETELTCLATASDQEDGGFKPKLRMVYLRKFSRSWFNLYH